MQKQIIFLDIETVPFTNEYNKLDERIQLAWSKKCNYLRSDVEETDQELYDNKAGIFAEFGRIVCVSIGLEVLVDAKKTLRIKSFYGHNEKDLLEEFSNLVVNSFSGKDVYFCAHNGKEFDFPYLCRRLLINSLTIPETLNLAGKKPWEVKHLDTLELWKFGDYKHYTSLELLASVFNISTSKDDIDGSQVAGVYYGEKKGLERIKTYCEKDVAVLAQVYCCLSSQERIDEDRIQYVTTPKK